jgi:hypothetical protein
MSVLDRSPSYGADDADHAPDPSPAETLEKVLGQERTLHATLRRGRALTCGRFVVKGVSGGIRRSNPDGYPQRTRASGVEPIWVEKIVETGVEQLSAPGEY